MNVQAKYIAQQIDRIVENLMPDSCQIIPAIGDNMVINQYGILVSEAPTPRLWRGKTDVRCRADLSRAFRPDRLKVQTTEVNEFNLELPSDVTVTASDTIVIRGHRFVIRKIKNISNWDATIECVIEEISTDLDNDAIS